MKRQTILWLLAALLLIGCTAPTVTPSPLPIAVTDTPNPTIMSPTATRRSTLTPTPQPTETSLPPTLTPQPFLQLTSEYPAALAGTPIAMPNEVISPENAGQLVELARWGKGVVHDVQYSPKGDVIAVASSLGVYFYDVQSGKEIDAIETSIDVHEISFSPDGLLLAVMSSEDVVWDLKAHKVAYKLGVSVNDIRFSPDSTLLAVNDIQHLRILRAADGKILYDGPTDDVWGGKVWFMPDGRSFIHVSQLGYIRILRVDNGNLINSAYISEMSSDENGDAECVTLGDISLTPNGQVLAVGCSEFPKLMIIDAQTLKLIRRIDAADWVQSVAISPDGSKVITGDYSGYVQGWDIESGQPLFAFRGIVRPSISFSPDGQSFVAGFTSGDTSIRRISDGLVIKQLLEPLAGGLSAISPDGSTVAVSIYRDVQLRRITDGSVIRTFKYTTVRAMSPVSSLEVKTFTPFVRSGPLNVVSSVAFSPDGALLAASYDASEVRVWRVNSGNLVVMFDAGDYAQELKFSLDGKYLAVYAHPTLAIFETQNWELVKQFSGSFSQTSRNFLFSPDSRTLAWLEGDKSVHLWDVATWSEKNKLEIGDYPYIAQIAFLSNSTSLVVIKEQGLQLWNTTNSALLVETNAFVDIASDLAISPDDRLMVTVGHSGYLAGTSNFIWDLQSQTQIAHLSLLDPYNGYYSVLFTPDGRQLLLGKSDGTIRVWGIQP